MQSHVHRHLRLLRRSQRTRERYVLEWSQSASNARISILGNRIDWFYRICFTQVPATQSFVPGECQQNKNPYFEQVCTAIVSNNIIFMITPMNDKSILKLSMKSLISLMINEIMRLIRIETAVQFELKSERSRAYVLHLYQWNNKLSA